MAMAATTSDDCVHVVSRRIVRPPPLPPPTTTTRISGTETVHLTPWDIQMITVDYIQNGVLLPKPLTGGELLVEHLASSFARALGRWFPEACPIPVTLRFAKLGHIVRRFECPPVEECFFHFSVESVKHLKATANAAMAGEATATISSLQSLLAHVWRSVSRARRLPPEQETTYTVLFGCRGRVKHIPHAYAGSAVVRATARATAGEIQGRGLGWTAWLLNRAVASLDEEALARSASWWPRAPRFAYLAGWWHPAAMVTGNSPRFDVFGNDFGWGRPVGVRSGGANKVHGRATVYEGRGGGGAMAMEVCLSPETLARVVEDADFLGRREVVGLPVRWAELAGNDQ